MSNERQFVKDVFGTLITFQDGRQVIDAASGVFNLLFGYNHPRIESAVIRQMRQASFLPSDILHEPRTELCSQLARLAPKSINNPRVRLRDVCGSGANEGAIKMAQRATSRTTVVAFERAHHGQSLVMTALSGDASRRAMIPATRVDYVRHVPYADGFQMPETIREALYSISDPACVIVEPVQGNGGNIVPSRWFPELLRGYCDQTGALSIADEVQTFGRLGTVFGSDAIGLKPDIVTLAKGLASGHPLGAIVFPAKHDVLGKNDHSFTSGGHVLSVAAALATLQELLMPGVLSRVETNGAFIREKLNGIRDRHRCVQQVQGLGHMFGISFVDSEGLPSADIANAVADCALEEFDLRLRTSMYGRGNTVKIRPPLNVSDEDLEEILSRLESAIDAVVTSKRYFKENVNVEVRY